MEPRAWCEDLSVANYQLLVLLEEVAVGTEVHPGVVGTGPVSVTGRRGGRHCKNNDKMYLIHFQWLSAGSRAHSHILTFPSTRPITARQRFV